MSYDDLPPNEKRETTRWSRPGQPGVWLTRDTSLGLAGRLISRTLQRAAFGVR
jgi:hypothetical protein